MYAPSIKMTIVHVYAPTEDADEQEKDEFYMRLQDVLDGCKTHDMLIITGDMNAKVGDNNEHYERVMGNHGSGQRNDNGERLCALSDMNSLVITGTLFPHKEIHKATWVSPNGKTRNQIDHILINRKFRNSVKDTRVFRSADIGSDHYLVCMKVKLSLRNQPKDKGKTRIKYDIEKLREEGIAKMFSITLKNRYQALEKEELEYPSEDGVESEFRMMEKAYTETAKTVLGKPQRKKKPWISEKSWKLISEREDTHKKILGTHSERIRKKLRKKYADKKKEVKSSLRFDKRKWIDNIAKEAEEAASSQQMRTLYRLTKTLCNEKARKTFAVLDKNGNSLSSKEEIMARWTEHFEEVLDRGEPPNPITVEDENGFDFSDVIIEIGTEEPTREEIKSAIKALKNGGMLQCEYFLHRVSKYSPIGAAWYILFLLF